MEIQVYRGVESAVLAEKLLEPRINDADGGGVVV